MSYCSNCGAKLTEGATFCHSCGTNIKKDTGAVENAGNQKPPEKKSGIVVAVVAGIFVLIIVVVGILFATGVFDKESKETNKETTEMQNSETIDNEENETIGTNEIQNSGTIGQEGTKENIKTKVDYITVELNEELYDINDNSIGVKKYTLQMPKDKVHDKYLPNVITNYKSRKVQCEVSGNKYLFVFNYKIDEENTVEFHAVYSCDTFTIENYLGGTYQHLIQINKGNMRGSGPLSLTCFGMKGEILTCMQDWGKESMTIYLTPGHTYSFSNQNFYDEKGNIVPMENVEKEYYEQLSYYNNLSAEFRN